MLFRWHTLLFGPSRILVLGPDLSLAAVILGVAAPGSGADPASRRSSLPVTPAPASGIVCAFVAGASRLGFVTEPLWEPIRYG